MGRLLFISLITTIFSIGYLNNSTSAATYSGGSGTEEDPYHISTGEDIITLGENTDDYDKYFVLTEDIELPTDINGFHTTYIAADTVADISFDGIEFNGSFNGNGHTVSYFGIYSSYYSGLFGCIGESGIVSNLSIDTGYVNSQRYAGLLCGVNRGNIIQCQVKGNVYSDSHSSTLIGGLCGQNYGRIYKCISDCTVYGPESTSIGGLCGSNTEGVIEQCIAKGSVTGNYYIGGLCGSNTGNHLTDGGNILLSYSESSVSGIYFAGGLCGGNFNGTISQCYANGPVECTNFITGGISGLTSFFNNSQIIDCYYNKDICEVGSGLGGWPLTDEQMKQAASFLGWIDGSWIIDENNDYPRLAWETSSGTTINTAYPNRTYAGSGTESTPFLIGNAEDICCLSHRVTDWDKHFSIVNDIDLSGISFEYPVIGHGKKFTGSFNGNGHTIENLCITGAIYAGLFSCIGDEAIVSNLGLKNVSINGYYNTGSLAGTNMGIISQCYAEGSISGTQSKVGGLISENNGTVSQCYTNVSTYSDWGAAGGFCADNTSTINQCFSIGQVYFEENSNIRAGSFLAENHNIVTNCFCDIDTSGQSEAIGYISTSEDCVTDISSLSTSQMQMQSTFTDAGWDFNSETTNGTDDVWHMPYAATGYPMLYWQRDIPGDVAGSYGVDMADTALLADGWMEEYTITDLQTLAANWLAGK